MRPCQVDYHMRTDTPWWGKVNWGKTAKPSGDNGHLDRSHLDTLLCTKADQIKLCQDQCTLLPQVQLQQGSCAWHWNRQHTVQELVKHAGLAHVDCGELKYSTWECTAFTSFSTLSWRTTNRFRQNHGWQQGRESLNMFIQTLLLSLGNIVIIALKPWEYHRYLYSLAPEILVMTVEIPRQHMQYLSNNEIRIWYRFHTFTINH